MKHESVQMYSCCFCCW